MKLNDLLVGVDATIVAGAKDIDIQGVAYDSRQVRAGDIFVAIPGFKDDGTKYAKDAIYAGATAIVATKAPADFLDAVTYIETADPRYALSAISAKLSSEPSRDMKIIGVTGTNGKTTCTYLLEAILTSAKKPTGVIGTINCRYPGYCAPAERTTPEAVETHRSLQEMLGKGTGHAVLEVSSHAIELQRTAHLYFDVAILTNLSQDHLDFHGSMEAYKKAKARLFSQLNEGPKAKQATAVVNIDSSFGRELQAAAKGRCLTYGFHASADICVKDHGFSPHGSYLKITACHQEVTVRSKLVGKHNAYNILASMGGAIALGMSPAEAGEGVETLLSVPGRLEPISNHLGASIYVDYAHTDHALENVLQTLRDLGPKRLITLFGCGGDRDQNKRPKMALAASKYSDLTIVTSDNPRSEDPAQIVKDALQGVVKEAAPINPTALDEWDGSKAYTSEVDRARAIALALETCQANDIILIAGKGHEDYQEVQGKKYHFDDRLIAQDLMQDLQRRKLRRVVQ